MKHNKVALLIAVVIALPGRSIGQDGSWHRYDGRQFSFGYPGTWHATERADGDAIVSDLANPISVEFAVKQGDPGSPHTMSLNAQRHVLEFAQSNNMIAKFESVGSVDGGGIRLISHVCSIDSQDLHFCPSNDPKVIDFSTVIVGVNGRILLVEMMHRPGLGESQMNVGRKIVQTLKLR